MAAGNGYQSGAHSDAEVARFQKGNMGKRSGFGSTPAVIVVDMTRAFTEDQFPLGCSETGQPCTQAIRRLLDVARPAGIPVYYTRWNPSWETDNERGVWLDKGTQLREPAEAHEVAPEIAPEKGDVLIDKAKPSAFFGTQLVGMLIHRHVDTVIVTGMVTSGCVRATAVDAFSHNFKVIVPEECVADRSPTSHRVNLFDLDQKYADVMSLDEVVQQLSARVATAV